MGLCGGNSRKGSVSVTVRAGAAVPLGAGSCQGEQTRHGLEYFNPNSQKHSKAREIRPESTANMFNEGKKNPRVSTE